MDKRQVVRLLEESNVATQKVENTATTNCGRFFRSNFETFLDTEVRRHPLGFFFLRQTISDSQELRCHLWPTGWTVPASERGATIHNHLYEIRSMILTGIFRQEIWDYHASDNGAHELCNLNYSGNIPKFEKTGQRIFAWVKDSKEFYPGTIYLLQTSQIHQVEPAAFPTATLLLATYPETRLSTVQVLAGEGTVENDHSFDRSPPLSNEEKELVRSNLEEAFGAKSDRAA